ncbi:GNAT family N-acetyltransferase [Bacillus sp. 2205SS5-2]|uniref:GNAT family N-acetyltransferase n=1 Tax=Bacillus sp. 2205SS5-2 TaxID=3109031 RepID=UPI0030073E07
MKVNIVRSENELQDAFFVRKHVFVSEQGVSEAEEIDELETKSTHFVLYDEEQPVGAGRFRLVDAVGKVERICVLSSYRGKGAGVMIMNAIEEYAKPRASSLKLNAQVQAIPFYERLGYEVVSGEFLDAGIPHKTMKKNCT